MTGTSRRLYPAVAENAPGHTCKEIGVAISETEFEPADKSIRRVSIFLCARDVVELIAREAEIRLLSIRINDKNAGLPIGGSMRF
jgi:hypothetical protein